MNQFLLVFVCVLFVLNGRAQQQESNEIIQQRIEFISEQLESENIDLTNVIEILTYRIEHPLNLNNATADDLKELNLLSDVEINDLILHRKRFGNFISIYELQSLTYWSMETIYLVLPFVKVDDKFDQLHVSVKEAIKQGKFEAFLRYQRIPEAKSGYDNVPDSILESSNSYYHGNPDRYYTRLRFSYRTNLSVGITAEKDPGEQFFQGAQKNGFDFYSFHAFYHGGKYLRTVALGDYQIQIGQGLNLWSGYAFGKTADVTNVKKSANPIKPYTSVDETRFMRGAAFEFGYKRFQLTTFASVKKVDATVNVDSLLDDLEFVSSINLTGFHRTNSEIAKKNGLTEMIYGGNLRYENRGLHIGVAGVSYGYDKDYNKAIQPYNQFDFRGKNTFAGSMDYSYVFKNFQFFGEASYVTHSSSFANLHGVLFSLDSRASMSVVYRNYQRGYETFYNAGFAEGSQTKNEKGIYTALTVKLAKNWTLNTYADLFAFPWMKYQVDAPSKGHEFLIQPTYRPNKVLEIYGRFRQQLRQKNSRDSDGSITEIEDVLQNNYRLNLSYKVSEDFTFKSRIEYVTINRKSNAPEDGFVLIQDFIYKPKKFPVDLALRYALIETDSYDSRIYTFESNALYVFSVPAYYYKGSRAYAMIRYTFLKRFDLWVRYGTFIYANRKSLGSGAEEINQGRKSDITVQLRIKF